MRRWRLFVSAGVAGLLATGLLGAGGAGTAGGATFVNWPQYLYSPGHSSDNAAATTITPANAASLTQAWQFSPGTSGFLSSPVVYNGVIYIGSKSGYFYALNETTGAVIWKRFIGVVPRLTCGRQGFTSTATVAPDPTTGNPTIYVYGATGYLYAMNTADGTDVWPPALVAIPSTTVNDYYAWSSPLVLNGNIYVGISSQCDEPLVPRRPGRVQPGQRGAGEHVLDHATGHGRRQHLVEPGDRRPVDLHHHRQRRPGQRRLFGRPAQPVPVPGGHLEGAAGAARRGQ